MRATQLIRNSHKPGNGFKTLELRKLKLHTFGSVKKIKWSHSFLEIWETSWSLEALSIEQRKKDIWHQIVCLTRPSSVSKLMNDLLSAEIFTLLWGKYSYSEWGSFKTLLPLSYFPSYGLSINSWVYKIVGTT